MTVGVIAPAVVQEVQAAVSTIDDALSRTENLLALARQQRLEGGNGVWTRRHSELRRVVASLREDKQTVAGLFQ